MNHFPFQMVPSEWKESAQRRHEKDQEQREKAEQQIIEWWQSQYGPLSVHRYSPHNYEPAPKPPISDYHYRIKRDGTITRGAPWNGDNR